MGNHPPNGNGPLTTTGDGEICHVLKPFLVRSRQCSTLLSAVNLQIEMRHVMNPDNLLATDGAVDNLFSFLMKDHVHGCYNSTRHRNIVWLSNHSCISCANLELIAWPDCIIQSLFHVDLCMHDSGHDSAVRIYFFFTSRSLADVDGKDVDAFLLLLFNLKNLERVRFSNEDIMMNKDISRDIPFPVSQDALQAFVNGVLSTFEITTLSSDQWHTIVCNHPKSVSLKFGGHNWKSGGAKFIEAVILNQCPAKLELWGFHLMSDSMFEALLAGLEVNTSIQDLILWLRGITAKQFVLLIGALQRNRGLSKLDIMQVPHECCDTEWECTFAALIASSHPTLKTFCLPDFGKSMWQSGECGIKNSLPYLLSNPVAVDTLFSFLSQSPSPYFRYPGGYSWPKFVWLSGHSCICNDYTIEHWPAFRDSHPWSDGTVKYLFHFDVTMLRSASCCSHPGQSRIFFFTSRSYDDEDVEDVDTVLLLLSKLKNVECVRFGNEKPAQEIRKLFQSNLITKDISRAGPFPASREALRFLVNAVPCSFQLTSLTSDQWRIVLNNRRSLSLKFGGHNWERGGAPLIEAMILNQCPKTLELWGFHLMPHSMFEAFVAALEVNTSIKDIILWLTGITVRQFDLLIGAIQWNPSLSKLDIIEVPLEFSAWEDLFATLIASPHPTLKSLRLPDLKQQTIRESLLQSLQSNTVLCDIRGLYRSSTSIEENEIHSILERNQLLHLAQSIICQNNLSFLATVLCAPDSRRKSDPNFSYRLLRNVVDGGVIFSSCGQRNTK